MKILITGAAGFIGSKLCEYLLLELNNSPLEIIAVDDLSGGFLENVPIDPRVTFIKGDLSNKEDQKNIEKHLEGLDYIYALSAYAAEGLSPFIRQFNFTSNVIVNSFLINCAIKYNIKRYIFTSSMAVYGDQEPPFDEELLQKPIDPYGIAKYACEMDIQVANKQHNLDYVIIRPHNVYGINQNIFDPYRNVLGIWMYMARTDKPFTIYGDGNQKRAFSYIDNILPCFWNAATYEKAKNQIINVGGIHETSLNDAADILLKITKTNKKIHLEQRHEAKYAWSTFQKSIDLLDYNETITLEEGLTKMWEWASKIPLKERKYFTEYELDKGIYSYWKLE
jgi:UDP-glucose 4-epimerase